VTIPNQFHSVAFVLIKWCFESVQAASRHSGGNGFSDGAMAGSKHKQRRHATCNLFD